MAGLAGEWCDYPAAVGSRWAGCAWAAWVAAAWVGAAWPGVDMRLSRYVALCLTGCAGVAVLGARRPVAGAWNFVVASLLVVLLWAVAEGWGDPRLNVFNATFLSAALAVGMLNYLPTRTAAAVLPVGAACAVEFCIVLHGLEPARWDPFCLALLAVAPWLGLAALRHRPPPAAAFDREWRDFRDRFGAVWGLPARDQFNRAAAHAGWGVVLEWQGLRITAGVCRPRPTRRRWPACGPYSSGSGRRGVRPDDRAGQWMPPPPWPPFPGAGSSSSSDFWMVSWLSSLFG